MSTRFRSGAPPKVACSIPEVDAIIKQSFSTVKPREKQKGDEKMKYIKNTAVVMIILALTVMSAMAQGAAADNESTVSSYKALAAGLGFGIAAGLGAIGQGLVGSKAVEGAARNPGSSGTIRTLMIIGLALIESLVLLALVIVFAKL
jgi:F-type H+-transporting ATPase subunit c